MKTSKLLLILSLLSLMGVGCRKATPIAQPSSSNTTTEESLVYLPPSSNIPPQQQIRQELQQALNAFQNTKSFKASMSIENGAQRINGQLDVLKPDRFHGVLQVPDQDKPSEMIGIAHRVYTKLTDGTWTELTSPSLAKNLEDAFRSTRDGGGSQLLTQLPEKTEITKSHNNLKDCDDYQLSLENADETNIFFRMCIKDGLPQQLDMTIATTTVSIEYKDYNKLFIIERPSMKAILP